MIEIFVGLGFMFLFSGKEDEKTDPEEYYPYMYDHFSNDDDWDIEDWIDQAEKHFN